MLRRVQLDVFEHPILRKKKNFCNGKFSSFVPDIARDFVVQSVNRCLSQQHPTSLLRTTFAKKFLISSTRQSIDQVFTTDSACACLKPNFKSMFSYSLTSSSSGELILPLQARSLCSLEWPHVLKLFLRRLQPLAQTLDVFFVWLVLLLVHFQQRSQDFDTMLFLCHTLSLFKLAYNRTVPCCFDRFTGVNICCG